MMEYNLDWLKGKGFFGKTVPLEIEGKKVLVDTENLLAYIEVGTPEGVEKARRGILSVYGKTKYVWFYFPSERKLKVFRKIGEVKWFYYSPRMRGEYLKSRIDKLNRFSLGDMNILFDIKDVVNRFYWQLWEARIRMARSVEQLKEEKSKLLAVQHIVDRLIFFYFLAQLGLMKIKIGDGEEIWKLDRTHTREFFRWVCGFFNEEELQEFLNKIFFDVLGKVEELGWSGLEFNIGGERFSVVAPSLNGGLFREEKIEGVAEREIKIKGTKELILDILNKYNWIIGEESPEEEDVIGDLTPEIIGHIYEKFVVSLEQIGLEKIDFDDIQTVKGELKLGRKKIGAYYTPEEITNYISKNTIDPCITDRINEKFKRSYRNIWNELLYKEKVTKERLTEEEVEIVKFLYFGVLTKLRICDNACGSGSFLIAAGEVLLRLYSRVIKLLKNYQGEDEEVKGVLEDIKRSPSRNYYIVRQIITNNLHGVDIMEGAVEIAKLRFWLWLISQVKPKEAEYEEIETLPNLDYNLVMGNSLIGFVDIKDIAKTLSSWLGESEEKWLKNLAKEKQKFKTLSVRDAGRVKEKLDKEIKKARVFLNRRFFETIKAKGIEMPYKDYEDFAEDLKPFHWGFEFSEVFELDKPKEERGFDVVIGNPPWGEILSKLEKRIIDNTFFSKRYLYNIFTFFIEASIKILKNKAKFGYILPKNMIRSNAYSKIREIILSNFRIIKLTAVGIGVFVGVTSEASIIITEKNTKEEELKTNYILCSSVGFYEFPPKKENKIKQEILYSLYDYIFNIFLTDDRIEILKYIKKRSKNLEELTHPLVGILAGDEKNLTYFFKKSELWKPVVRGDDVSRYGVDYKGEFVLYDRDVLHRAREEDKFLSKEKLLSQHVSNSLKFGYDARQLYCMQTINLFVPKNNSYSLKCLLTILNSALMNFFYQRLYNIGSEFTTAISLINLRRLPIKLPKNQKSFESLCNYLLFLNETLECRELEKELIEFIDTQVIDSLVYELYFREKFEEEGLETNLLGLVEPYLKDIESLKTDKEKLKVIKEVVDRIMDDRKVMGEIEKIKSYEWVKVIEKG